MTEALNEAQPAYGTNRALEVAIAKFKHELRGAVFVIVVLATIAQILAAKIMLVHWKP